MFPIKLKRAVPETLAARFPDLDRALDLEQDADDPAWTVVDGDIPAGHLEGLGMVCGDRQLLFEEAPTAYKRIELVVGDLVDHGLATPVATTIPLVTYKTPDLGSHAPTGSPRPPPQAGMTSPPRRPRSSSTRSVRSPAVRTSG